MESDESSRVVPAPIGKKRIPKACSSCRQSKVKCDGKRPCSRCDKLRKHCIFFEIPKDPTTQRLEHVEAEVLHLREQLDDMRRLLQSTVSNAQILQETVSATFATGSPSHHYPQSGYPPTTGEIPVHSLLQQASEDGDRFAKRRRAGFEVQDEPISDFINKGLITVEHAMSFFRTFFEGCDRYIPIFDPQYDTFHSVRGRSSILLNAICTIGCRVEMKSGSQMSDLLHAELKKWINVIIQNEKLNCLESVQAMLVVACYSAERSLILSFATRMALDLRLQEAYEELTQRLVMREVEDNYSIPLAAGDDERLLMRKSRTWFGLLVLEHIFRVDGGKPPGIRLTGNARRCRILLGHPSSTVLDLRLLSQVELNVMRANINDTLGVAATLDRSEIADFMQEAKVDLDVWFDDWLRIIGSSAMACDERPYLLLALRVQKCWAEMMLHCKALRAMGVENVAAMSPTERNILFMAKANARKHLRLITASPDFYLAKFKYAMDFVWAKCAFCFLLLLKLSRLLPEREEEHTELMDGGDRLLHELTKAGMSGDNGVSPNAGTGTGSSASGNGNGNGGSNIYLQILKLSIEKYGRTVRDGEAAVPEVAAAAAAAATTPASHTPFWELFDAQADLQSFVPEQFVSEWDFPGLNLFYFPTAWQDFLGDFSLPI